MDDSISRQAAVEVADAIWTVTGDKNVAKVWQQLKNLPSAQPEIVRCRDCIHSHLTYSGDCKNCDMWQEMYDSGESLYLKGDFFCAFGKKKETNGSDGDK